MAKSRNCFPSCRFNNLRKSAIRRNIVVTLNLEDYKKLLSDANMKCEYCKDDVSDSSGGSLDRVDNDIGYTIENCKVCCGKCNMMKREMSMKEFFLHVDKIHKNIL